MGSRPGSPYGLEDKAPWTSLMFNCGGFTDSSHPHEQETRGLDIIQATSFFPWWLLLIISITFWKKREICIKESPEIRKNPEKTQAWFKNQLSIYREGYEIKCPPFEPVDKVMVILVTQPGHLPEKMGKDDIGARLIKLGVLQSKTRQENLTHVKKEAGEPYQTDYFLHLFNIIPFFSPMKMALPEDGWIFKDDWYLYELYTK